MYVYSIYVCFRRGDGVVCIVLSRRYYTQIYTIYHARHWLTPKWIRNGTVRHTPTGATLIPAWDLPPQKRRGFASREMLRGACSVDPGCAPAGELQPLMFCGGHPAMTKALGRVLKVREIATGAANLGVEALEAECNGTGVWARARDGSMWERVGVRG